MKDGSFTLPAEAGYDKLVKEIGQRWKVDAIRDSDGTALSDDLLNMGYEVYSTLCLPREDLDWALQHPDQYQQRYLMSERVEAESAVVEIDLLKTFFTDQVKIDSGHDPKRYWEVMDRTTGNVVDTDAWEFVKETGSVQISATVPGHVYTVSFLTYNIWDTVSMHNHLSNNWTTTHRPPLDPRHPDAWAHMREILPKWLADRPHTTWVRFTTLFYNFAQVRDQNGDEAFRDWTSYMDTVSALSVDAFEKQRGYRPRPEVFTDNGNYNLFKNVPSKEYLDWISFTHEFVTDIGKECVDMVHRAGKKAIMFYCDHWIGTEPYLGGLDKMGFDGVVSPGYDGTQTRRLADLPTSIVKESRLYPYFFEIDGPMVCFAEGGDPTKICKQRWTDVRRAMLRHVIDRIGFGGYLHLVAEFPDFVEYVEKLGDEFRTLKENSGLTLPYAAPFKVGILNAWGKMRSWVGEFDEYMEALTGLPFEVEFMNFDDIRENGVPDEVGVLINGGVGGTAWSGGEHWLDEAVTSAVRAFVERGGGLVGIDEPSAAHGNGAYFQLSDVLGVERHVAEGSERAAPTRGSALDGHFILEDTPAGYDMGPGTSGVYGTADATEIIAGSPDKVLLSSHAFGKGRGVYMTAHKMSTENTRILHRALYWAAGREDALKLCFTSNPATEAAFYPETGNTIVVNNSAAPQETVYYDQNGRERTVTLEPHGSEWLD